MANYSTLNMAIAAGLSNMTVLRNHSRNDDGTTMYATGIDWFYFNSVLVSSIYSSGNSWLGFGANSEHLQVNRRDCAVWDEYKETGLVSGKKFLKFTWKGTSYYSSSYESTAAYQQYYDVFLFETGQIFLNFWNVPTTTGNGNNYLNCSGSSLSYSVTAGVACQYTFTPSDPAAGTGWSVESGPPVLAAFKSSGFAEYSVSLEGITSYSASTVSWAEDKPTDTLVSISAKIDNGTWQTLTSGSAIPGMVSGRDYSESTLYIRISLATEDVYVTPTVSDFCIVINDGDDAKTLIVTLGNGTASSIQNAIGIVRVLYDGTGGVAGTGGPVQPFDLSFTPSGLLWKGHQNDAENIELSGMTASGILTLVEYTDTQGPDHIELSNVTVSGVLTHIDDT